MLGVHKATTKLPKGTAEIRENLHIVRHTTKTILILSLDLMGSDQLLTTAEPETMTVYISTDVRQSLTLIQYTTIHIVIMYKHITLVLAALTNVIAASPAVAVAAPAASAASAVSGISDACKQELTTTRVSITKPVGNNGK